jgi:hypothetical protein
MTYTIDNFHDDILDELIAEVGFDRFKRTYDAAEEMLWLLGMAEHMPRMHARTKRRAKAEYDWHKPHVEWLRAAIERHANVDGRSAEWSEARK